MPELLVLLLTGCLLGFRHAMDADHVVAVTTIVGRQRSFWRAASAGALWGLGHTATILVVGLLLLTLRITVPPRLGLGMEFVVALMLVGLGLHNLLDRRAEAAASPSAIRPLAVGMVHGLAGSAAVTLLVVAAVEQPLWGAAYLLIFGLGTTVGMVAVTAAIALPSLYASSRMPTLQRYLRFATGTASLVFGLILVHEIGVSDGLFGADPQWDPH